MKQLGVCIGIHAVGIFRGCSKSRDSRCEDMGKVSFHVRVPALIMHGSEGGDCSITSTGRAGL